MMAGEHIGSALRRLAATGGYSLAFPAVVSSAGVAGIMPIGHKFPTVRSTEMTLNASGDCDATTIRRLLFAAPGPLTPPSASALSEDCPYGLTWQVRNAYTLGDALAEAERMQPDLLVVDLSLPPSNGEAASAVSAPLSALQALIEAAPAAAAVALIPDSIDQLGLARQAFMAGAQDVLTRSEAKQTSLIIRALRTATERKIANAVTQRMRDDYVRLVDNAPVGIFRTTPGGRYLTANRALAEMYGYERPENLIEFLTDIGNQLYVDSGRRAEFARTLAFSGRLDGFESEVRRRDGSVIWISESARVVCDDAGTPLFYEGFVRNITPRKVAEEKLKRVHDNLETTIAERTRQLRQEITERRFAEDSMRQAKEQAEAAAQTRSRFLANMSHELRTPLNAIIGFSQLMEMDAEGPSHPEIMAENANHIRKAGEHLLALINDLLDTAKIDAGQFDLAEDEVDLASLAYDVCTMVQGRAEINGCKVVTDVPGSLPQLRADRRRLFQILLNLAGNAVKFTPEGGTVTLFARLAGEGGLDVMVTDTGIGMAPEDIPRALSEFGQVGDPVRRNGDGTGLGLPLAKKLTELHGGVFTITSQPGQGTQIHLCFPPERTIDHP